MAQCLEGKALAAMNGIRSESFDYDELKDSVLEAFQLSLEHYRQKFHNMNK